LGWLAFGVGALKQSYQDSSRSPLGRARILNTVTLFLRVVGDTKYRMIIAKVQRFTRRGIRKPSPDKGFGLVLQEMWQEKLFCKAQMSWAPIPV
jgi:hypothetical protein